MQVYREPFRDSIITFERAVTVVHVPYTLIGE